MYRPPPLRSNREKLRNFGPGGAAIGASIIGVIAIIVVSLLVFGGIKAYGQRKSVDTVVTKTDRVCSGGQNGKCQYLVYTEATTYKVKDSFLASGRKVTSDTGQVRKYGSHSSSDFYGAIRECHRYHLTFYGFRLGFGSHYQNLVTATDLGAAAGCVAQR